jgi:phosphatidate cytidylyltransferase
MLKQRIITAVIALSALLIVLFVVPPKVAWFAIAAVILLGAWEWSGLLQVTGTALRVAYVILIGALVYIISGPMAAYVELVLQVSLVSWVCALIWIFYFPTKIPVVVRWTGGALLLVPLFLALVNLYRAGPQLLLFSLLVVWFADSGAYFVGKKFGRVKLAPSISPGKTWEGVFGGLIAVIVLTIGASFWLGAMEDLQIGLAVLVPFFLAVACLSIVGDLTVSMFKRNAGVKDSGKLFPGHGGILDRIDSVAAAAPLVALGLIWVGSAT